MLSLRLDKHSKRYFYISWYFYKKSYGIRSWQRLTLFVSSRNSVLGATQTLSEPKQFQAAKNLITFHAQEAGLYHNAGLTNFWKRVLLSKHSDSALKFLKKLCSLTFRPLVKNTHQALFQKLIEVEWRLTMFWRPVYLTSFQRMLFRLLQMGSLMHLMHYPVSHFVSETNGFLQAWLKKL